MNSFKIQELLNSLKEFEFKGDDSRRITRAIGITDKDIHAASNGMSWVSDKNLNSLEPQKINVGLLVVSRQAFEKLKTSSSNFLIVENPRSVFFEIVRKYFKTSRPSGIERSAVVDPTASIGKNCYIGHHVVVEKNCSIGDNTQILHNTVILEGTIIGKNVRIGSNNTIGNYGFGYEKDEEGNYQVLDHLGRVEIEDGVEIHNNTCIDRGVLGATRICENTKIDNLVHIAHGVVIQRNSLIIANAMIAGSAVIGENTWIAPSVSVKNKIVVAPDTMTGIGAVVLKDTQSGMTYIGNPAVTMEEYKNWATVKKSLEKKP